MKVEVSCFVGGMVIKEIVHVDKFEDANKVAKSKNPFCKVVNKKVLIKWTSNKIRFPQDFVNNKQKDCLAHQLWSSHQNIVSSLDKVFPEWLQDYFLWRQNTFYKFRAKVNGWKNRFGKKKFMIQQNSTRSKKADSNEFNIQSLIVSYSVFYNTPDAKS